jgi:hypothetical protein
MDQPQIYTNDEQDTFYNITKLHKFHTWSTQDKNSYITMKLTLGDCK